MIHNVIDPLIPLLVDMSSLHIDPANARENHDIAKIAASLRQYGQRKPIVINKLENNKIEAGNGTYLAANSLGWTHIAAVTVEDDPATAAGYGIAYNRVAEFSEWNLENLKTLTDSLEGLDIFTGWDSESLTEVMESKDHELSGEDETSKNVEAFNILITCDSEFRQSQLLERFLQEGLQCRALIS
jgi:hypothetical protein